MPHLNDPIVQCCNRDAADCDCLIIGNGMTDAFAEFVNAYYKITSEYNRNLDIIATERWDTKNELKRGEPGWLDHYTKVSARANKRTRAAGRLRSIKMDAIGRAFYEATDDKLVKFIVSNYWPQYWSEVFEVLDHLPATPSQVFELAREAGFCEVFADAVMKAFRHGLVKPEDFDGDDYERLAVIAVDCHGVTQYDESGALTFPIWWIEEWADVTYLNEPDMWAPVTRVQFGNFFTIAGPNAASNTTEIYLGGN